MTTEIASHAESAVRRRPHKYVVWIPAGRCRLGSEEFYPEERPIRDVRVGGFWMDEHPVTNAEFRRFVKDTGYVTAAERTPDPSDFPGADPAELVPGSLVFAPSTGPVPLDDWTRWWRWVPGADWRHPDGPDSTLHGRELHPVVHVGYEDATTAVTRSAVSTSRSSSSPAARS